MHYEEQWTYRRPAFGTGLTPVVKALLIANGIVFLIQILSTSWQVVLNPNMKETVPLFDVYFGLNQLSLQKGFLWQFVTYMFLHGNFFHLLMNMFVLYMFGPEVERTIGQRHFIILYFLSGILGGIGWLLISKYGICVGASGAIFGILAAFATLYPNRKLILIFPPVIMKAWQLVAIYGAIEFFMVVSASQGGIANSAHLAGGISGCVYIMMVFKSDTLKGLSNRIIRRKPKFTVVQGGKKNDDPITQAEVDRILDKISNSGITSLTYREKKLLERASRVGKKV